MVTRDALVFGRQSVDLANTPKHSGKAESVIRGSFLGHDSAVTAEDSRHHGTSFLLLVFQELHQIGERRVAESHTILVAPIQLRNGILLDMFGKTDCLQGTDVFSMFREEKILIRLKELLRVLGIKRSDHVKERVHEKWPEHASQLRLVVSVSRHAIVIIVMF
jgi:hypothetical protein